ncbi:MAG: hypothetical protein JWM57_3620 [Phycisphaerales bacterium]|nr:hypothetical protein [Phycisphaerales bacterium]
MAAPKHLPHKHGPAYKALLRYSRALHTYASIFALITFTFFAVTGFMLNHSDWFGLDSTHDSESTLTIPADVLAGKDKLVLVEYLRAHGVTGAVQQFDWPDEGEPFHVAFKSPRSKSDADITLPTGETRLTVQTQGLPGLMTRLHTAKDAGRVWQLLVDATAIFLLFVCLSGLVLWQSLPKRRKTGIIAFAVSLLGIGLAFWLFVP